MPTRGDWAALARDTFRSVGAADVTGLYTVDWREAAGVLTAEHRARFEKEPRSAVRAFRLASAFLYGLTRRLAPRRRVLLASSLVLILYSLLWLLGDAPFETKGPGAIFLLFLASLLLLALLVMELVDKLRFRDELELARRLQADLMPETLPPTPGYDAAAVNIVANTVGGDLYEVTPLPDGRISVLFGDASGHGMAAGLVMAVADTAYRAQVEVDPSPLAVATALNKMLCRTGPCRTAGPRSFFAAAALLLDPDGRFSAVVAGNPPLLKVGPSGNVIEKIGTGAYPLGIRPELKVTVESGILAAGEGLVLHSDGLPEARNDRGEELGDARIEAVLGRAGGLSASLQVSAITADLSAFLGRAKAEDDVSVFVLRRLLALPAAPETASRGVPTAAA